MNTTETDSPILSVPRVAPVLRLLCIGGENAHRTRAIDLQSGELLIGREVPDERGIGLPHDHRASRVHARVHVRPPAKAADPAEFRIRIVDEGSKNGTFLNGHRVTAHDLKSGDIIRIGNTFMLLRIEPAQRSDAPADALLGEAPAMRRLRSELARAAPSSATVLLLGESGAGKDVAARTMHQKSGRSGPLVPVNCAAIPENLAESELFGHIAGAFSGARVAQEGFFRAAHRGTLFLDEIGELAVALQPKLLRALEDHAVVPVGSTKLVPCDVRVIAATNCNLREAVLQGRFRGDLYARLAAIEITVPPLRERREDILPLLRRELGLDAPPLSPRLIEALLLYHWPYNVRELIQLAANLHACASQEAEFDLPLVSARLFPAKAGDATVADAQRVAGEGQLSPPVQFSPADASRRGVSNGPPPREVLVRLMAENQGIIAQVARAVGKSRRQVRRWLLDYGILRDDGRS